MNDDMVPKSDLIALKEGHTKTLGELTKTHEDAITSLGTEHISAVEGLNTQLRTGTEELGRARATVTKLEEEATSHSTVTEELETSKTSLKASEKSLKALQDTVATGLRSRLENDFKIVPEALKDKSLSELTVIVDALSKSGGRPNSKNYTSGGGGGESKPQTGRDKVKEGLAAGELQRG